MYKETEGKLGTPPSPVRNEETKPEKDRSDERQRKRERTTEREKRERDQPRDKENKGRGAFEYLLLFTSETELSTHLFCCVLRYSFVAKSIYVNQKGDITECISFITFSQY